MSQDYLGRIGNLIRDARKHRGLTQQQLADLLNTSQSAVTRIEKGQQNLSLEMLARIGSALDSEIVTLGAGGPTHLRVTGPTTLSGTIDVKSSKNAGVALLCASLLNKGRTTLRKVARIEEVNRLLEVLQSLGVQTRWLNEHNDLEIVPPATLDLANIDEEAARRTRSIIMFLGPLLHRETTFDLPYAGGCNLGTRTVEPHMSALRPFGLDVKATEGSYHATVSHGVEPSRPIVLTERGDTVTENALMAAALQPTTTVIRNASSNYMVQDLCFYLQKLGVTVEGIGTTTLRVTGLTEIDVDVDYAPSEDPIEAMSLLAAAIVTQSEITIRRVPIEFLEIELATLEEMGFDYSRTEEYAAENGQTRLVDVTTRPSRLRAPSTRSTRCPSRASTSTTCRSSPSSQQWPTARRCCTTGSTRTAPSISPSSTSSADRSSSSTRTGSWSRARPASPAPRSSAPGAATCRRDPAGDARGQGHLRAPLHLCHPPRLRRPGRPAQRARRQHRDLPRHLSPTHDPR